MKRFILYIILVSLVCSCISSKKNVVICPGVINIKESEAMEVYYDSLDYNKENEILKIYGRIIDLESGCGIWGANIVLFPQQQKMEGISSQKDGIFNLEIDTNKYDSLRISYLGYKSKVKYINQIITKN